MKDNPALRESVKRGQLLPVFILDEAAAQNHAMGAASRWWLHRSLESLNESLDGHLRVLQGDSLSELKRLCKKHEAAGVSWNRCYEPWRVKQSQQIKDELKGQGLEVISDNGCLLWEPWETLKDDGTPYRVFSPFFHRGCNKAHPPREPLDIPGNMDLVPSQQAANIEGLGLLPSIAWHESLDQHWSPGEAGAHEHLQSFLETGLDGYKDGRNFPDQPHVSRLSPHLHFGEISPNTAWYGARQAGNSKDVQHFLSELGWREFSYSLLYHNPDLPRQNLQKKFDAFPWREDNDALQRWQHGRTGYPIVDAGMRELWQTGYMHNRVRMIVGSFLVKNLMLHWHHGERWFWDTLADADLANNSASWQWIAGCGADAAPYFRIFNPVTQSKKFDPDGHYIRRFVPELADFPDRYLHAPWEAPAEQLNDDYPSPIVDLKSSRERALDAFKNLPKGN